MDLGGSDTRGQIAALIAGAVLVVLACMFALEGRLPGGRTDGPSWLALGGAVALFGVSAASLLWASAPDLAWIDSNRMLMMLAALAIGFGVSPRPRDLPQAAVVLSLACLPIIAWALLTKILPDLAPDGAGARLAAPLGSFNALALVGALALPGALWLTRRDGRTWGARAAAAYTLVLIVVVALTYSRSGAVAMLVGAGVLITLAPNRPALLASLASALVGALPAIATGLTLHGLTTDGLAVADRRGAGALLGVFVLAGALVTLACRPVLERLLMPRSQGWWRRAGALALALVIFAVTAVLASGGVSDTAVGNGSDRVTDVSFNNRIGWWGEAIRGFASAPLFGHGAGSFPLVHLRERANVNTVRSPHQLVLQIASDLGAVGVSLLVAMFIGIGWAAVRVGRNHGWGNVAPALAVCTAFLVSAQVDVAWSIPLLFLPPFALAGMLVGSATPRRKFGSAGPVTSGAAIALATAALASLALPVAARHFLVRGEQSLALRHPASARSDARIAASLNPFDIRAVALRGKAANALGDAVGRRSAGDEAVSRQPENPLAWACLVSASGQAPPLAAVRELARLNPRDPAQAFPPVRC